MWNPFINISDEIPTSQKDLLWAFSTLRTFLGLGARKRSPSQIFPGKGTADTRTERARKLSADSNFDTTSPFRHVFQFRGWLQKFTGKLVKKTKHVPFGVSLAGVRLLELLWGGHFSMLTFLKFRGSKEHQISLELQSRQPISLSFWHTSMNVKPPLESTVDQKTTFSLHPRTFTGRSCTAGHPVDTVQQNQSIASAKNRQTLSQWGNLTETRRRRVCFFSSIHEHPATH